MIEFRTLAALGRLREALARGDELLAAPEPQVQPYDVFLVLIQELRVHGHRAESHAVAERAVAWILSRPAEERQRGAVRYDLAYMLYLAGRIDEAREIVAQLAETTPQFPQNFGLLGVIAAAQGDRETARRSSERLAAMELPYLFGWHTQWRAAIAAHLGDLDGAVALLREAFSQGLAADIFLHSFVPFEPLQAHPPFQALMRPKG